MVIKQQQCVVMQEQRRFLSHKRSVGAVLLASLSLFAGSLVTTGLLSVRLALMLLAGYAKTCSMVERPVCICIP